MAGTILSAVTLASVHAATLDASLVVAQAPQSDHAKEKKPSPGPGQPPPPPSLCSRDQRIPNAGDGDAPAEGKNTLADRIRALQSTASRVASTN